MASTLEDSVETGPPLTNQSNPPKRKGTRKPVKSYPHLIIICCVVDIHLALHHVRRT
jgi:hypothetical protein